MIKKVRVLSLVGLLNLLDNGQWNDERSLSFLSYDGVYLMFGNGYMYVFMSNSGHFAIRDIRLKSHPVILPLSS